MSLTAGTRLGPYEIAAAIGAGGMGEVYQATDTNLKRQVAIKVLPAAVAVDSDRLARFQREAEVLAALNHPNIAQIFGLEKTPDSTALVLELVEGEDLSRKIEGLRAQGRGLPLEEALPIAKQIAEALEAAHEQGIIHRDLKPANIKVRADGMVKVLDFGLAKAMEVGAGGSGGPSGLSMSPTLSLHATMAGVILGTAAYMSPEQARGKAVDKRADIWAFGAVLFEMLTGRRPFPGEDITDTIVSVVSKEPDWSALPAATPPGLRRLLVRCLKKDPKARMRDIGEARLQLEEMVNGAPEETSTAVVVQPVSIPRPLWKRAIPIATSALVASAIAAGVTMYLARSATPAVVRFFIMPPDKMSFVSGGRAGASAAISPDGRRIVFSARDDAQSRNSLWIRGIDALTAQPLPGTDAASFPFWSPDNKWIAYFAHDKLMKIPADGGPSQTLCDAVAARGGAWNRDGVILFGANSAQTPTSGALSRVASAGGQPVAATKVPGGGDHRFPAFLPDGRHFLFYSTNGAPDTSGVHVGSLGETESHRIVEADSGAIYSSGHLLYVRQATLLAQPFDLKTLKTSGDPVPVAERLTLNFSGILAFSVSDNGTLAYGIGPFTSRGAAAVVQLTWLDRRGKPIETVGPPGAYRGIDLAPDGRRIAVHRHEATGGDIWIIDGTRVERFTFDAAVEHESPIWSPDGEWIAFSVRQDPSRGAAANVAPRRSGQGRLYRKRANGVGAEELLVETERPATPFAWAPDGLSIAFASLGDIFTLPLSGDRKPVPVVNSPANDSLSAISPNGKWLAYQSGGGGRSDVFVRPYGGGTGTYQVSDGGGYPRWRGDGQELFYLDVPAPTALGRVMAVDVRTGNSSFTRDAPHALFDSGATFYPHPPGGSHQGFAVSRDGQRFLVPRSVSASPTDDPAMSPIAVVLNWAAALQK